MDHGVQLGHDGAQQGHDEVQWGHGEDQLGHGGVQLGHGKPRGHAQEVRGHDGMGWDHGGELLLVHGGMLLGQGVGGQLDGGLGEGEGPGHCGAEPGDEVPENRKPLTFVSNSSLHVLFWENTSLQHRKKNKTSQECETARVAKSHHAKFGANLSG